MDRSLIEKVESIYNDQAHTVNKHKEKEGLKAIGLALTDVPFELVHAAGAIPVTVFGRDVEIQHADKHIQGFACAYSRSVVEMAETGGLGFLDGLIMPYVCDTTRCLDLIFKYMDCFGFFDCLRIPRRNNGDGVSKYYKNELKRLAENLGKFTGTKITDGALSESIKKYNQVRSYLEELRDGLRKGDNGFSAADYFAIVRASMILPPDESISILKEAVAGQGEPDGKGAPTVVITGKMAEPPQIINLIENAGLTIVEDHLIVGGRWSEAIVEEDGDPWDALINRQLNKLPFSGIWDKHQNRASYLIDRIKTLNADGAVFLYQKFCENAEIDLPGIKDELDKENIPLLSIETDLRDSSLQTVKTKIEAFSEMLQ